jgi:hypothetical protein
MKSVPTLPSEKKFGLFMSTVFFGLAIYAYFQGFTAGAVVSALIAGLLCAFALIAPDRLSRLNQLWFQFGLLLGKVVSPVVLGVMFFLLITPVAIVTRLLGRDALRLKRRSDNSHWVNRTPPGPSSDSFKNQF